MALDKLEVQDPSQPFVRSKPAPSSTEYAKHRKDRAGTIEISSVEDTFESRHSTGSGVGLSKTVTAGSIEMKPKRESKIFEVGELVKDVFSRSSTSG